MQSLNLRHPTTWGAGALALTVVVALVAAWLYVSPPGQKTIVFFTDDASSIHPGDQVRIAGVPVGKVKDLAFESDRVRVRARVDENVFIGDQSQIEVRMLTVVGGYYVNIDSLGASPLGTKSIPVELVKTPYSLMLALADSTKITDKVNPKPLKESLDQLQQGLTGDNVETLSSIVDAGNSLMSIIENQRGDVTTILNFSDEYIRSLNNYGDGLREIIRKVAMTEQTLAFYSKQFGDTLLTLGNVLTALTPVAYFYLDHRDAFLEKVRNWLERGRTWAEHNGVIIRSLRSVRNKVERLLDAQNAPPELLATDICIPTPGSLC